MHKVAERSASRAPFRASPAGGEMPPRTVQLEAERREREEERHGASQLVDCSELSQRASLVRYHPWPKEGYRSK